MRRPFGLFPADLRDVESMPVAQEIRNIENFVRPGRFGCCRHRSSLTRPHACLPSSPSAMIVSLSSAFIRMPFMCFPHQSLHRAVQHISVVAAELGVGTLQGWVSGGLGLLDTVLRGNPSAKLFPLSTIHAMLNVSQAVAKSHSSVVVWYRQEVERTRCGEPSCSGCAETSSWTLFARSVSQSIIEAENRSFGGFLYILAIVTDLPWFQRWVVWS